jgi:HEPN pEK499 p136
MMYEDVVAEFAWRTQQNLRAAEDAKSKGANVFETTQLINSMLGLLVFPREEYIARIPRTPLAELRAAGWPLPSVRPGFAQAPDLAELVRYLRNAISHFNLEFQGDSYNQIAGIRVWNINRGNKTWEADLRLDELRGIAERFTRLLVESSNFRPAA